MVSPLRTEIGRSRFGLSILAHGVTLFLTGTAPGLVSSSRGAGNTGRKGHDAKQGRHLRTAILCEETWVHLSGGAHSGAGHRVRDDGRESRAVRIPRLGALRRSRAHRPVVEKGSRAVPPTRGELVSQHSGLGRAQWRVLRRPGRLYDFLVIDLEGRRRRTSDGDLRRSLFLRGSRRRHGPGARPAGRGQPATERRRGHHLELRFLAVRVWRRPGHRREADQPRGAPAYHRGCHVAEDPVVAPRASGSGGALQERRGRHVSAPDRGSRRTSPRSRTCAATSAD